MKQSIDYTHIVLPTGVDCDGYPSDEVYKFANVHSAESFANELNDGSDGLVYIVVTIEEYKNL